MKKEIIKCKMAEESKELEWVEIIKFREMEMQSTTLFNYL